MWRAIMRSDDPSDDPRILTLTYTSSTTDLMSVAQLVVHAYETGLVTAGS